MMNREQAEIRISELTDLLNEANRRYYVDSAPMMSDYEFDMRMKELEALEQEFPDLASPDSPTLKVGSDLSGTGTIFPDFPGTNANAGCAKGSKSKSVRTGGNAKEEQSKPARQKSSKSGGPAKEFEQHPHKYPMLSLGNTYDITEVEAFADRAAKSIGNAFTYSCELKFDGTAICLTYRNGKLFRALTRGDGTVGDDVTENVRHIGNIPQELKVPEGFFPTLLESRPWPEEFEIRGEIYMPWAAFERLNIERQRDEEQLFANPRNAASGSLKLIDSSMIANRGLECTLYHVLGEDLPFSTHDQALKAAGSWGLPVSDKRKICHSIADIEEFIAYWDTQRKTLPFATDGIVIKVNELPYQEELGYTAKFPRWAVAYKFKAEQALTKLISVDYQVGRTGAVTPVANLEPVLLSGTVVKRASLHNEDQMKLLDVHIGDYVYVEKGGEIIPKITAVEMAKRPDGAPVPHFPDTCPDCGTSLVRDSEEAKAFCPNTGGCPTQIKERLIHFLSRKAMNVIAGEATIEQLYSRGMVLSPADFYELDKDSLLQLEGWKDRSAERFLNSLSDSKKTGFEKVLYALGIRYVGESTAKSVARHFGNIDAIASASVEELLKVEDVGQVIAESIYAFFADEHNLNTVRRLKDAGLRFETDGAPANLSSALEGKTIVISGNFSISRDQMKALITSHGGKNSGSISGKTSWLLAGEKPGPEKLKKAEALGVPVISEEELMEICRAEEK